MNKPKEYDEVNLYVEVLGIVILATGTLGGIVAWYALWSLLYH